MKSSILTFAMLALAAAGPATALTLTFNDRGNWTSQVTGMTNFDSGTQAVNTVTTFNTSAGLTLTDLQIVGNTVNPVTGTAYDLQRVNTGASPTFYYQWNSGSVLRTGDKTATNTVFARISFTNAVSAFGFSFGAGGASGAPGGVTIAAGGLAPVTVSSLQQPNLAFWGVASDSQAFTFADIYINDTNRYLVLDDIAQGGYLAPPPPTETAEPGTLLQLAMGLGLLAMVRRKFVGSQSQTI
ncbi:MAG: hypothetical protein ACKV2U_30480 [Bryobacteraceae bacterium]